MDKKRLSPKQIFRTLAFHYHYDQKIPLDVLCDMVSGIYYPKDPTGQSRKRYKNLLIMLMKQFTNGEKFINQAQFCAYMIEMDANKKTDYSKKLTTRIFDRYAQVDPDSKEKVICLAGFKNLASIMKISPEESQDYFKNISDRKHQIDFDKFNSFMSGLVIPKKS